MEKNNHIDFDIESLPWVDREDFQALAKAKLAAGELSDREVAWCEKWNRDGYVIFKKAISESLIENLLLDYEQLWRERPPCEMQVGHSSRVLISELPEKQEIAERYRTLDFHSHSVAGREIALSKDVIRFFQIIFNDTPVAMQSLLFEFGSEQEIHQDFVFVPSGILSHLGASWVALEDVDETNGPLSYYPGSHKAKKYDWGEGRLTNTNEAEKLRGWNALMKSEVKRLGLEEQHFHAKRGDLLLWHGALCHGGSPHMDKSKTRKSFIVHYSSRTAFPRDYRSKSERPKIIHLNGGVLYEWKAPGHIEGRYPLK